MIRVNPLQGRAKRRIAATLAALAVLASASAGMADRADAKAPREFFGVVPSITPTPADYAQMKTMGVGTLRTLLAWPVIEPSPGMYDWTYFDEVVAGAAQQGIQVFPTIFGSPDWPNVLDGRGACGAGCAVDGPQGNSAFTAFIQAAVRRYGPNGEFWNGASGNCVVPPLCPEGPGCGCGEPLPIRTWQVWNEQNSPKYFHPKPNPAAYAGLVKTASSAIRSVDPGAEVVLGGMWGPTDTDAVIPTPRFLKRFYAVPGIEDTFDSIAVHPYSPTLAGMKEQMKRARAVMRKSGDGGAGIWVTELGWASGGPRDEGLVKTPKAQGRLLDKAFRYMLEKRKAWKIRGITWYSWRDALAQQTDCRWCPRAGLRTMAGGQKPAGALFRKLALTFGRR
jgi:GH35 family endo-1,4-beta-xylanase